MKKFRCRNCNASRIWLHNWAVAFGICDKKFVEDYQRNISLSEIKKRYDKIQPSLFDNDSQKDL